MLLSEMLNCSFKICILPCIVPAMGLNEIHVSVFGQEGHQLVVGPKNERKRFTFDCEHLARSVLAVGN